MLQDMPLGPLYTSYKRHAYEGLLPFRYVTSGESGNTHIQKIKKLVHQRQNNVFPPSFYSSLSNNKSKSTFVYNKYPI